MNSRLRNRAMLEWQSAKNYINVNSACRMLEQKHARALCKFERVAYARMDSMRCCTCNRTLPFGIRKDDKRIDILRESRSAKKRHLHNTADNNRIGRYGRQPFAQIGQRRQQT